MWAIAKMVSAFAPDQDAIAASVLLLAVLGVATLGDRTLAVVGSVAASLSFSYYFVDSAGSFRITSPEGAVSFAALVITAMTGSQLSVRLRVRAEEAERRRGEMERLQRLGATLFATNTLKETAEQSIQGIVSLFGGGAILRIEGFERPFQAGVIGSADARAVVTRQVNQASTLELFGIHPSIEVQSALVNLIGLVLDRAVAAEERTRIESVQRGELLRTTILNALAHNFRTPLTCIKAAASMMRGSTGVPATYSQELVEVIDEEADRLDELIRDSLDLARIESRRANPRVEACSMGSIVSGALGKMKRYMARQLILVDIPENLPVVRGDRFLFEQMVTQVLDNAWKYAEAGARIWISARQAGDEVVLTIQNEGSYIPHEERGLVFDRFYRGTRNRASVEGTGLGLAIAKTIAEAHGGRVWLDAEPEGPAFRFAFPVGAPEEENDREPHYFAD
jgi:two-component system sensor histidine kinase KdpD